MQIEVASLSASGKTFEHHYQAGELVLEDERVRLIDPQPAVSGRARTDHGRVKVTGEFTANLQLECDRCLKSVDSSVKGTFSREYATAAEYEAQRAVELSEDDLDLSIYDGQVIDIDGLIREELLLAAPDPLLCQPDCRGICPTCGADLTAGNCNCEATDIDPRWAALKELVNGK